MIIHDRVRNMEELNGSPTSGKCSEADQREDQSYTDRDAWVFVTLH